VANRARSSRQHSNTTGKPGNASGSRSREARGDPAPKRRGKHPRPRIFTAPQAEKKAEQRKHVDWKQRQSERGDNPRD
jgi:hypothetical protein